MVTHSENMLHAYDFKLYNRNTIYKKVLDICSGEMFKSIKDASDRIGIPYSTCKNYLNGRRINKTCLRLVA